MFGFVKEQTAEEKDQSLADVTEHSSENEGICDGNKPCRIHFVVGRKSIHFYIHFKRFEKLWILKLCRWLFLCGSLLVFHEAEDFFIVLNILLESKGILFSHPATQNIEGIGISVCAGGQFTDVKASGAGFKSGFCGNDRRAVVLEKFLVGCFVGIEACVDLTMSAVQFFESFCGGSMVFIRNKDPLEMHG